MAELTTPIDARIRFERKTELVDRLREGDERAFEEVFDLYRDMVYGLSMRLLAEKSEALDVTQEVFLTLFRKIGSFRGECTLKTWLYRVTLNQAANRNRWWKRRRRDRMVSLGLSSGDPEERVFDLGCRRPEPDRQLESSEIQAALQKALDRLPYDQKAVIVLRDVQGLSYEEIAELLDSQLGTIKSRIARGRERMREMLRQHRGSRTL